MTSRTSRRRGERHELAADKDDKTTADVTADDKADDTADDKSIDDAVPYTHLTLQTKRLV